MSNLKSLKNRIKSVNSTKKITSAMKAVAASKLKKAKQKIFDFEDYLEEIQDTTHKLLPSISEEYKLNNKFLTTGKSDTYLIIMISSDRGLCGSLNSSLVKYSKRYIEELLSSGKKVKLLFIGRKAYDQFKSSFKEEIVDKIDGIFKKDISFLDAKKISSLVVELFNKQEFKCCKVIYNKFYSPLLQKVTLLQLMPLINNNSSSRNNIDADYSDELLEELFIKNIESQIYKSFLESIASEYGARMSTMESATNNAKDMLKKLTLNYNRTRQANITKELIDIISGANSG